MSAYYNEFDPYAAAWLRNLIAAGHLPAGDVDERSITDVQPDDLTGYTQCHFFAGIGGWAYAARIAGWPDDREIWTGSPPCQPFSVAGKGKAQGDDRHLWPHLFRLASARRPAVLMGEQVAAAVGHSWLDGVLFDLEGIDYACRAAIVPACAVNAPHRRDRLWFVAERRGRTLDHAERAGLEGLAGNGDGETGRAQQDRPAAAPSGGSDVADPECSWIRGARSGSLAAEAAGVQGKDWERQWVRPDLGAVRSLGGAWSNHAWIIGHDGKARRVEPGIRLLAHGIPARVGRLRAYGNAIVPQVAVEVIGAYMDCVP